MAGNFMGMDFDGDDPMGVAIKVRGRVEYAQNALKNMAEDAARRGAEELRVGAPRGDTGGLISRIDHTDAEWNPGGAGGGGYWEAVAGVLDTGDDYPLFVFKGTGQKKQGIAEAVSVLQSIGLAGEFRAGRIYPSQGNVFPMMTISGLIFRAWHTGQEPQTQWVENAQRMVNQFLVERMSYIMGDARSR